MNTRIQIAVCLAALGCFLAGAATSATPVSQLPLRTALVAKPNVIFGMDDSGSMDSEVMLYNNDGAFWWNFDTRSGWGIDPTHPNASLRSLQTTWFYNLGAADETWRKMIYLFPNGTGDGLRSYGDARWDHFAVLPTRQFAFLRWAGIYRQGGTGALMPAPTVPQQSPLHNPLFYNTLVDYKPWAPAELSTGPVDPAAAEPKATRSHPIEVGEILDLTVPLARRTADNQVFTALPGMVVPAGSLKRICDSENANCGGWVEVSADEVVPPNRVVRVAMSYYIPTFWIKESCTPENASVANDTCVRAPDGSFLKRYQIRDTTGYRSPSGRTYKEEMDNFANWFQYHRKRRLMLASAMGETMETLTGMRLGVAAFNKRSGDLKMYDADSSVQKEGRQRVAGIFYEADANGGTPTRETLKFIGEQYKRNDRNQPGNNIIQYACQRNNAFLVTDGFANNSSVVPPPWDSGKSASLYGAGPPYSADFTRDGILADLALRYYTNNPRPDLSLGRLSATPRDPNTNLHINTYGLSIGARGTLFLSESTPPPTTSAAWPNPNTDRNPSSVDDLWRATLSGRGRLYLATTPEETAARIRAGLNDILDQPGAQGGVAVSTVNLARAGNRAYIASYSPAGWTGDLQAVDLNALTGEVSNVEVWSAAKKLDARAWSTRVIASWNGREGVEFDTAGVGTLINPDGKTWGDTTEVVNYLRGDRSLEGSKFRQRRSLFGAVLNAEPVVDRETEVVYVASGGGMLHAFDTVGAAAGEELWAYVPGAALGNLGPTTARNYTFSTQLDGTPVLRRTVSGKKLLVSGMGVAGRAYFALDVTTPRGLTATSLKSKVWEFPKATDSAQTRAKVGQTLGKPAIVKLGNNTSAVLVTSGYNTTHDGKGRLWMLNADTGAVIKEFVTLDAVTTALETGLAQISPLAEVDGTVRYVYGGDLRGNVWRFDLALEPTDAGAVRKIAQLRGPAGANDIQPVTTAPELLRYKGHRIVYVGTGRLLDVSDFGNTAVQSVYAIKDDDGPTLANARNSLVKQTLDVAANGGNGSLTTQSVNWTTQRGWYIDIDPGEQINTRPVIAYGALVFMANKAGASDCSASSRLYVIEALDGTQFDSSSFVSSVFSTSSNATAVSVVLGSDGKSLRLNAREFNSGRTLGRTLPAGGTIRPAKNSWREVRR